MMRALMAASLEVVPSSDVLLAIGTRADGVQGFLCVVRFLNFSGEVLTYFLEMFGTGRGNVLPG